MKALLAAVAILALAGCGEGFNNAKLLQSAQEEFPGGDVRLIPGEKYKFIVRAADGSVWYVESMKADSAKPTAKAQLFAPR